MTQESVRNDWNKLWQHQDHSTTSSGLLTLLTKLYILPPSPPSNYFLAEWLSQKLSLREMSVVEIGGTGTLGLILCKKVKSYTLIDYTKSAIEEASRVLKNCPNVNCLRADMFDYNTEKVYDLVISSGLIEHFFDENIKRCLEAHARLSRKYVCVSAPADNPLNWWRAFGNHVIREYPNWRPMPEKQLFDICMECSLDPVAMTRMDPYYGQPNRCGRLGSVLRRWIAAYSPKKNWALDRSDGGLAAMLVKKC